MDLDSLAIQEFKDFVVESANEDVYYQLKEWVWRSIDSDQDYEKAMDFFLDNLHGGITWTNN